MARAFRARSATRAGNWIWHGGDNRRDSAALAACRFFGNRSAYAGIGALLQRIDAHALNNIRIIAHDAVQVIEQMIEDGSLDGAHIFFPDPWPKARHHKRRLIQPAFVARLAARLAPGAYLHCATDWQD